MMLGELIFSDGTPVYSPIADRPGFSAMFSFNVSQSAGTSPSLQITLEHKNRDEASWTSLVLFTAITGTGSYAYLVDGLREILRIKFVLSGTNAWQRVFTFQPIAQ